MGQDMLEDQRCSLCFACDNLCVDYVYVWSFVLWIGRCQRECVLWSMGGSEKQKRKKKKKKREREREREMNMCDWSASIDWTTSCTCECRISLCLYRSSRFEIDVRVFIYYYIYLVHVNLCVLILRMAPCQSRMLTQLQKERLLIGVARSAVG